MNLFFIGTAGSGKTALTHAFHDWLTERGLDAITVNLDPGAELLPYTPEVDVRDWLDVKTVMEEYGVGPNGAQILSADLIAVRFPEVKEAITSVKSPYVIIDTPGQIELFAFRQSSKVILESLGEDRSAIFFLMDPVLGGTPSGFVSLLMLSASAQFRFLAPFSNILAKSDLLAPERLEELLEWGSDYSRLYESLVSGEEGMHREADVELFRALENMGLLSSPFPASSKTYEGMEDIYNVVQQTFFAGEDAGPD
ncbi:MAG: GTPase [Methanobacteriota archaeon]|nr:MAG: GTPase [Euryarchaeota archaeon]